MLFHPILIIVLSATAINVAKCYINRLPEDVKPIRYFLNMEPDLEGTFNGSVVIEIAVAKNTSKIILHQNELTIDAASIVVANSKGDPNQLRASFEDDDEQTYTIELESELLNSQLYNLTIGNFSGNLRSSTGFFLSSYESNFTNRFLAATHLEFMGARKAFPCFDEPSLKAKFIVSLIRREGYNSVSNAELETTENLDNGRFKDTFQETPVMSTYTLAFAVSDYKFTERMGRNRVLAKPSAIDNGEADFALDMGVKVLEALEKYTDINFAINKIDHFAIYGNKFPRSAMENWGLVIYRQSDLLTTNTSTKDSYKNILNTIAHEVSHMWFGNLVTAAWWDYLWLNEGFATYFGFYIADQVEPSWRFRDQFLIDVLHSAFYAEDAREDGAYPLNFLVKDSSHFPPTHIVYDKAASIIRMAEHFLTADVFRTGLQIYLQNKKFGNVVPSDLYNALQDSVDKAGTNYLLNNITVGEILGTWDSNKGVPVVRVSRDYKTGSITLQQTCRFDHNTTSTPWIIPINYAFSSSNNLNFSKTTVDFWLTAENVTINNEFPTDGWLILNKQQTGYYRVNYDLENWERLIQTLNSDNFTSIHVLNRIQLIGDAVNMASRKEIPWRIPLRLCEYLVRETDRLPFATFYEAFSFDVLKRFGDVDKGEIFDYFQNQTLTNVIDSDTTADILIMGYIKRLSDVTSNLQF